MSLNLNVWDEKWGHTAKTKLDFSTRRIFAELQKVISFQGKTVLELGCGTGRLSFLALESGAASTTLVDNSQPALQLAKDFIGDNPKARFIQSDIRSLSPELRADFVLSSGLVEHFKGKELNQVIQIHRRLAKEKVLILVPASPHYNDIRMRREKSQHEYGWQRPFTKWGLRRALRRNQLQVVVLRRFFVTYGMKDLTERKKWERLLQPLESWIGGLLLAVAIPT